MSDWFIEWPSGRTDEGVLGCSLLMRDAEFIPGTWMCSESRVIGENSHKERDMRAVQCRMLRLAFEFMQDDLAPLDGESE